MSDDGQRHTIVSFHAHPDDEALLTAGTLARAAASGHRVVLVMATDGAVGLAADRFLDGLGKCRREELAASAAAIGAARVEFLDYADSGSDGESTSDRAFSRADVESAAGDLARILREEAADVLTIYDAAGGYGHPDHVQVHRVGRLAAVLADTPVVLEATVDRRALLRGVLLLRSLSRFVRLPHLPDLNSAYTDHDALTHCVDVRGFLDAKRTAMRAHTSQASSNEGARTLDLLLRLPRPVARVVLGREWFREVGLVPAGPLLDDIFATLGSTSG